VHKSSAKWPVVITTGALGVVGLGLGVGFYALSEDKKNEAIRLENKLVDDGVACSEGTSTDCKEYVAARQSFYDWRTAETVSLIAGGALVTTAIVMAIVWPGGSRPSAANLLRPIIAVDHRQTFFGLSGQF